MHVSNIMKDYSHGGLQDLKLAVVSRILRILPLGAIGT